ncbi:hypothetical protein GCM10017781_18490 [Deinococcus metalli]|uniref:Uncharacterized protein n=1 Tax=Deinococcus metalli TaxID=1141878 RepID=A0ABQ3JMI1_9DEIO|nr:hypothetical protein GCM10017781_18490 [Deinococcus metalli]
MAARRATVQTGPELESAVSTIPRAAGSVLAGLAPGGCPTTPHGRGVDASQTIPSSDLRVKTVTRFGRTSTHLEMSAAGAVTWT